MEIKNKNHQMLRLFASLVAERACVRRSIPNISAWKAIQAARDEALGEGTLYNLITSGKAVRGSWSTPKYVHKAKSTSYLCCALSVEEAVRQTCLAAVESVIEEHREAGLKAMNEAKEQELEWQAQKFEELDKAWVQYGKNTIQVLIRKDKTLSTVKGLQKMKCVKIDASVSTKEHELMDGSVAQTITEVLHFTVELENGVSLRMKAKKKDGIPITTLFEVDEKVLTQTADEALGFLKAEPEDLVWEKEEMPPIKICHLQYGVLKGTKLSLHQDLPVRFSYTPQASEKNPFRVDICLQEVWLESPLRTCHIEVTKTFGW